ncbi:MAG: sensor histidine kinase [Anaerolineales bacterium]
MNANQQNQMDAWEKWEWLWKSLFYATILVSFGIVFFDSDQPTMLWVTGLLTVVMLLWHWFGMRLAHRGLTAWDERPLSRFVVILGDIVLWFFLVNLSPAFYIALFGLFIMVFRHLPIRYAMIAAVLLMIATVVEQFSDTGGSFNLTDPVIWLFFFMVLVSVILGFWITNIINQSTQRRQLIEQLEATRAELAAAERREGILEERQRLAREIHDTLAQGFTSIVMHLEAAEGTMSDTGATLKHIDRARSTARSSLEQARRVVRDLQPDSLEKHSLPEAIERAAIHWGEETGIPVAMNTTGNPLPLHPNIEVTLLRAAQEALHNIHKHAQATNVQLTLSYMGDVVILDVQDDGVGLEGAEPSPLSGGYGLQAMRERVEACSGTLTLESDPGEGTTVVVTIPLSNEEP